jgi:hypothetical protein
MKSEREHTQGLDDVPHLPSHMSKAGFEDVTVDIFGTDRVANTRIDYNKSIVGAFAGITKMFVKFEGGTGYWTSEAAAKLAADAESELINGDAYYRGNIILVSAHKTY